MNKRRMYTDEYIIDYVMSKISKIEVVDKIFNIECPICNKVYQQSFVKVMNRIKFSKTYEKGEADMLPCSKGCRAKYITNLLAVKQKIVNTTKKNQGDDFYKKLNKISHEAIKEKYGSFSECSKKSWENYFNKTGYKHNMLNPVSVEKNKTNRKITIKSMTKERKKIWSDKRFETYRINNSYFGNKRPICSCNSKIANFFFEEIKENFKGYTLYFGNNEKKFEGESIYSHYFVDFFIEELNIAIEFNGDYWHANPEIYSENDEIKYSFGVRKAKEIWEKDLYRKNYLSKKYNLNILTVWEKDVIENKQKAIALLLEEFLY